MFFFTYCYLEIVSCEIDGFFSYSCSVMFLLGVHSKQSGYCASEYGYPKMKFSVTITEEASHRRSDDTLY